MVRSLPVLHVTVAQFEEKTLLVYLEDLRLVKNRSVKLHLNVAILSQ